MRWLSTSPGIELWFKQILHGSTLRAAADEDRLPAATRASSVWRIAKLLVDQIHILESHDADQFLRSRSTHQASGFHH